MRLLRVRYKGRLNRAGRNSAYSAMKVKVLFFGATAELVGTRELETSIGKSAVVANVINDLATRHPKLKDHRLLLAVNEEYISENFPLKDGDELAIFTPVSGG